MPHSIGRRGRWSAFTAAASVFVLYLLTVPHDLAGAGVDSAKFAYIPRLLGVPHPPGYPLYMLLGWLFSHLPTGTLAFRMNLLSSVFGAATAGLIALIALELGCGPITALLAALLAGTGPLFWSQAIIAEVYTLHTLLVAGMFLGLVRWARTRATLPLYAAAACFGLGLAHHTDIALFVPAILLFLALTDVRILKDVRVVATACGIIVLCLALYVYAIVRTRQHAAYLEVVVNSARDVIDLVRGHRFEYLLFRQPFVQSIRERGPTFVETFRHELGIPGVALATAGIWVLWRRARPSAAFAVAGILVVLAFAISYFAYDVDVFLLPGLVLGWILVAVGLSALARSPRILLRVATVALVAAWSIPHVMASYRDAARQSNGFVARFARVFFQRLPPHAAIVDSSIDVAHVLLYKAIGERAAEGKDLILAAPDLPSAPAGVFVYAQFANAAHVAAVNADDLDQLVRERSAVFVFGHPSFRLRLEGFRLDPVRLPDRTIPEFLASLPRGHVVIAAAPRVLTGSLLAAKRPMFESVGAAMRTASPSMCYAAVGVAGDASGAIESSERGGIEAARGQRVGSASYALPVDISAHCGETAASVSVNGRLVSRTDSSVAIVVLTPAGDLVTETSAPASAGLRVPFEWMPMNVYRIGAPRSCAILGRTWSDVTAIAAEAGTTVRVPAGGSVNLYLWSDDPLRVRAGQANDGDFPIGVDGIESADRPAVMADAGIQSPASSRHLTRVRVQSAGDPHIPLAIALGGRPVAALARVDGADRADMCALTIGTYPILAGSYDGYERVLMDDSRDELLGAGWHGFEPDATGGTRWTSADPAHLLVPLGPRRDVRIVVEALVPEEHVEISIAANGRRQAPINATAGWNRYEWVIPADQWNVGMNDLTIGGTGTVRRRDRAGADQLVGLGIREIDFQARP